MTSLRVDCPEENARVRCKDQHRDRWSHFLTDARASLGRARGFAALDHVLRPAHSGGRVEGQDAASGEAIEREPDGREVLLDGRGGMAMADLLNVGGKVDRADIRN